MKPRDKAGRSAAEEKTREQRDPHEVRSIWMEIKSRNKALGNVTYFSYLLPRRVVLCFRSILEQEKAVMRALLEGLNHFQLQISVQATVGSAENSRLTCLKSCEDTWEQKCR